MNREPSKVLVLGGAFSTGKSTIMQQLREDFGEKYRYIMDGGRQMLELYAGGRTPENLSQEELEYVQRAIMHYYIHEEKEALKDGRYIIADGSLIEVAAYSQFVLNHKDFQRLDAELRYRSFKNTYNYVKFPATLPIEYDGVRHSDYEDRDLIDKRIDRVLARNDFDVTALLSDNFIERYVQIISLLPTNESN